MAHPAPKAAKPQAAAGEERKAQTPAPSQAAEKFFGKRDNQLDRWLAIEPDGSITAYSGKVELGTGVRTALAQIVAEELDVPFERIHLVMGDTALTPDEGYTAGSTTIQVSGRARAPGAVHATAGANRTARTVAHRLLKRRTAALLSGGRSTHQAGHLRPCSRNLMAALHEHPFSINASRSSPVSQRAARSSDQVARR